MATKTDAPKAVAPPTIAPPAPKSDTEPVAAAKAPDPNADSKTELNSAIADIVRLYRAGDFMEVYQTYTTPDKLDPESIQKVQESLQKLQHDQQETKNPQLAQALAQNLQQIYESSAQLYEALENQTPTFNTTGDEATYMMTKDSFDGTQTATPITFIKINGKWYLKPEN